MSDDLLLSRQLCFAVLSAARAFERRYAALLAPLGLTYPQYLVMLALWARDDQTLRDLGAALHLDSGTLTPLLKRMEAAGHVTRARDREDERLLRVRLTDAGRALRDRAAAIPAAVAASTGLSPAELAALRDAMRRLGDAVRPVPGSSDGG
ncbi:MAG: MarR family winged helix-turn-helix transcriptional regulator [Rubrimonas sp.]